MERDTVGVKCPAQEHNTMSGLKPGSPNPESRALNIKPSYLNLHFVTYVSPKFKDKYIKTTENPTRIV